MMRVNGKGEWRLDTKMMNSKKSPAERYRDEVQVKIQNLLDEFSEGDISREQFNVIYARYSDQLLIAEKALVMKDETVLDSADYGVATVALRQATTGMAVGMAIHHQRSSMMIEMLGDFSIAPEVISPILNSIVEKVEAGKTIEPDIRQAPSGSWMVFTALKYTTVVTVFTKQPAPAQVKEIQRLHTDFETANHKFLAANMVKASDLAYPFLTFVEKKLKR